jgi:hypothetical protein
MSKIEKKLQEAQSPDFWGQIQIDYQAGKAVVVRKIETIKLNDEDNNRANPSHRK